MADTVFVIHPAAYRKMSKGVGGLVEDYIKKVTAVVAVAVEGEAPGPGKMPPRNRTMIDYATGELLRSISSKVTADGVNEVEGVVVAGAKHATFLIHGTRPHLIVPKKPGKMLRFFWHRKGAWAVLPYVNHPGTIANDFMSRGLKKGSALFGIF